MSVAAASAILAFNLVCSGTRSVGKLTNFASNTQNQVETTLRIDLDAKRWCSGECLQTSAINEIRETEIILRRQEDKNGDQVTMVDRETGKLFELDRSFLFDWVDMTNATCEKAPFTGFPRRKF